MSSQALTFPSLATDAVSPSSVTETTGTSVSHISLSEQRETTITAFDAREWDALVPLDEPHLRSDFLVAVEKSGMSQSAEYCVVRGPNAAGKACLLGVAVVYRTDIDLLSLASPKSKNLARKIRRGPLQRLLIVRAVTCGPLINNCRSNFFIAPEVDDALARRIAEGLLRMTGDLPGGPLRLFFELNDEQKARYDSTLTAAGFISGASLPGTKLDIKWPTFDAYTASMRKFYRRAIVSDREALQGLDIRVEEDFAYLAEEACALYENVLERAQTVIETLTPAFFAELGKLQQTRLVTMRDKQSGQLVGIELLLLGENTGQDLYAGIDYDWNESHRLYFNLSYPGIDLACREGLASMSMGQTSYAFKSRLGVTSYPLHIYVKHRNPLVHWLLGRFHSLIFPLVEVPSHRVFRSGEEADANYRRSKKTGEV